MHTCGGQRVLHSCCLATGVNGPQVLPLRQGTASATALATPAEGLVQGPSPIDAVTPSSQGGHNTDSVPKKESKAVPEKKVSEAEVFENHASLQKAHYAVALAWIVAHPFPGPRPEEPQRTKPKVGSYRGGIEGGLRKHTPTAPTPLPRTESSASFPLSRQA